MEKRQIIVEIDDEGNIVVNNSANPNEQQILKELSELSELLNGDKAGFKVEKHTHTHGGHAHVHVHTNTGGNS